VLLCVAYGGSRGLADRVGMEPIRYILASEDAVLEELLRLESHLPWAKAFDIDSTFSSHLE
jgi:hypothetical protein